VATLRRWSVRDAVTALDTCTIAHLTPAMLTGLLERGLGRLRTVVCAGSTLPDPVRDRAREAGVQVVDYYGAAELSFVAIRSGARLLPFPQVEVQVREGVIWARSPWLCQGYVPGQSGPLRHDAGGWATVGDRGRLDDDGGLHVLGRDDTVNTGGSTVACADVEAALRTCAGVLDAVVVGTPHPHLGELLEAVVVGAVTLDLAAVRTEVAPHLSDTHLPRRWHHWTGLPLTPAGKVDRPEVGRRVVGARESAVTT
jgi:acyl-CoA synthetase (AMP-forming)/AMP-acid ligase II